MNAKSLSKSERYKRDLSPLLDGCVVDGPLAPLCDYLKANSSLPGPRGNLELAGALGDAVADAADAHTDALWRICLSLASTGPDEAPVNDPGEFVAFCGAVGLGAVGAVSSNYVHMALVQLRDLARDPRWRMREAVCFGLQRMMAVAPDVVLDTLDGWIDAQDLLEMRAVVAAVADPPLLKDPDIASRALALHCRVLDAVAGVSLSDRKSEPFKVLRQGLAYTLSVVTVPVPEEGFALLQNLAVSQDRDLRWIVAQNLKKKRLTSNFPDRVDAVARQLARS